MRFKRTGDEALGDGLYSFKLKSGEQLPRWTDSERPISVEAQPDGITFWYRKSQLRRVH